MKVALVAPTYLPARRANTIQVMKMCQALVINGANVRLAVPADHVEKRVGFDSSGYSWENLAKLYGLQVSFPVDWLPSHPWLRRYDYGWRAVAWAEDWGAEVIYTRLPQAAVIASWRDMKTVLEVHDLPQGALGPILFRFFLIGAGTQRIAVVSQSLLTDLIARFKFPDRPAFSVVAPDGVDLERYADLPEPQEARRILAEKTGIPLYPDGFTIGYTGHLYEGRGLSLILEMASQLEEVTVLIVGGNPSQVSLLRQKVAKQNLRNVILTGFVDNSELPNYQAACELLLMPYQTRVAASSGGDIGQYLSPLKMFEYMACGRVILSSDLPVLREVLNSQNARLLPPDDMTAWVSAIQELRQNLQIRNKLSEQARQDVRAFTWESRARRILEGI
jgi:glycosyltransferase involved in cell wall biosynthesis